jgi:3-ketoacyl-CoA synthase
VCFTAVRDLLNKTGITPRQIKVVIVNCSLFNPTPSLSATIMNHFKMGSDTINYNLSGMGCSGGSRHSDMAQFPASHAQGQCGVARHARRSGPLHAKGQGAR